MITYVPRISLLIILLFTCILGEETIQSTSQEVFGEYCFAKGTSKGVNIWKWEKYKGTRKYLFSYIPCSFQGDYSFYNNTKETPLFGGLFFNSAYKNAEVSKCSKEHFDFREYVTLDKIQETREEYLQKLRGIKDTYYDVHWKISYDSNYVRLHHSGTAKIYISGFCTEEQLKAIRERKEKELKENQSK